jgi:hypothetical protein
MMIIVEGAETPQFTVWMCAEVANVVSEMGVIVVRIL